MAEEHTLFTVVQTTLCGRPTERIEVGQHIHHRNLHIGGCRVPNKLEYRGARQIYRARTRTA